MEFFKLKENGTTVKKEVIAGITTFMTMAYILAVNPQILGETGAGMNTTGVFMATIIASIIATVAMALLANYPFALAPGMGLNAYFAFTVVQGMGYSWQWALAAVFAEGIIFILLTLCNVREALFNAIPHCMKCAVSAGIGLFITFIGLKGAGIIVASESTYIALGDMLRPQAILCIVGVFVTAALMRKNVKGAVLIGILVTYVLGIGAELLGWYQVGTDGYSLIPALGVKGGLFAGLSEVAFKLPKASEIFGSAKNILNFIIVLFSFLFVDLFDTLGTLMGVAHKANYINEKGELPRIKQAFLADAIGTTVGALLGTSTVTTFVESSAGVAEGGRTGLTSIVTAICFALAIFLSPIFLAIPSFATAPALIIVGVLMLDSIVKVDFSDMTEALPAFLTLVMMPFAYSISEGIIFGGISYVAVKVLTGKHKEVSLLMYILAIFFIAKLVVSSPTFSALLG